MLAKLRRIMSGFAISVFSALLYNCAIAVSRVEAGCSSGDLRVTGSQGGVGGVEMCLNDSWGMVCSNGPTDPSIITVICRQLGYSVIDASGYSTSAAVVQGISAQCSGRESSLQECSMIPNQTCSQLNVNCSGGISYPCPDQYQCWSEHFCISTSYLCDNISDCTRGFDENKCPSVGTCSPGNIRLADGVVRFGRVEICTEYRSFAPMADIQWTVRDASVACRQLGFSGGIPVPVEPGTGLPVLLAVDCKGNESNLNDCTASTTGLGTGYHVVGILCSAMSAGCQDGDIRLVGGVEPREGQVEVCYNGIWGRVCSQGWSYSNAAVVCRQLGYSTKGALPITNRYFDIYASPILMGNVFCSGEEPSLLSCNKFFFLGSQNENQTLICDTLDHVGVRCDDYQPTGCTDGSVRLSERGTPRSGKLQLCLNNTWSEFCGQGWNLKAADVVCRQLGFVQGSNAYTSTLNSLPQAYLDLNCSGTEGNLLQCVRGTLNSDSCFIGSVHVQCSELYLALTPLIPSTYTLRANKPFHLSCIATGSGTPHIVGYYDQFGYHMPISTTNTVDLLNGILLTDHVIYGCIATNGMENISTNVTFMFATPTGDRSDAYWRGSIPAITRVTPILGLNTSAQFLNVLAQHFVNGTVAFPGLQVVTCTNATRREADVPRGLDRIQCSISSYGSNHTDQVYPPHSVATDIVQAAQTYVTAQLPFFPSFTAISNYPFCDANKTISSRWNYSWPETMGNTVVTLPCTFGPDGSTASRECTPNGIWQAPKLRYCTTFLTYQLSKVPIITLSSQNIIEITQLLVEGVSMSDLTDQTQQNMAAVGSILDQTAELLQNMSDTIFLPIAKQATANAVVILDQLQRWPQATVIQQGSKVVQTLEKTLTGLVRYNNFTSFMASAKDIGVDAEKIDLNDAAVNGRHFTASNGASGINVAMNRSYEGAGLALVYMPGTMFGTLASGPSPTSVGVLVTAYSTAAFFTLRGVNNSIINSPIVGVSVVVNNSIVPISGLMDPIQIDLNLTTHNTSFANPRCVFWDYAAAGGRGNWSEGGCTTTLMEKYSVRCKCNHLTNFACLVDIGVRTGDTSVFSRTSQQSLKILSIIGVLLSLLSLVVTMTTYALFKKLRSKDSSKLHIQLCAAMFCMFVVFLFGIGLDKAGEEDFGISIDKTENIGGCVVVSVLIHYFTLVTFMVMAAESLLMFQKLVVVFVQITTPYLVMTSILCWSLPLVPVIIPLTIDRNYLITKPDNVTGEGGYCYISHVGVFFGAFLGPIFAVILFNGAIFIMVSAVLVKHTLRKSKHKKSKTAVRLMVVIAGLTLLFGLTWAFGALTVSAARLTFSVLFVVFNAFQGFFIFLMFCVMSTDVWQAWGRLLGKEPPSSQAVSKSIHALGRSMVTLIPTSSNELQLSTSKDRSLNGEPSTTSSMEESSVNLAMKVN